MLGPTRPGVGLDAGPTAGEASHQGARRTFSSVLDAKPVPSTRSVMMSFSRSFTYAASRHHGRAERSHCGGGRRGKVGQGGGGEGKAAEGAACRRLRERIDHVFLDAILDALRGHDHACRDQTGWFAPVATQSNAACREPNSGPSCGGKWAEASALLCSLRHRRAAAPPPDARWRVAACSAGTCTWAVRGRSASERRC